MVKYKNFDELKVAVAEGVIVYWYNNAYKVTTSIDKEHHYITCVNGSTVGLYLPDYKVEDFYSI